MNSFLAEMYGTAGAADESEVKVAQYEAFAKLAADNGVDLSALSAEQINVLFEETVKAASDDDDEDDKVEKAKAEHEEKKESSAKLAEADFIGRQMAHAFTHELSLIQKEAGAGLGRGGFTAAKGVALDNVLHKAERAAIDALPANAGEMDKAKAVLTARNAARRSWSTSVGGSPLSTSERASKTVASLKDKARGLKDRAVKFYKDHPKSVIGGGAGLAAAGVGGGAYALGRGSDQKKAASALDELAAVEAVKAAAAAGYDMGEVAGVIGALIETGSVEETKVAYVAEFGDAVQVRGLELLEAAGVPVNWDAVFGG